MMPQYYFQTHGLDVNRDIENLYVGSQESSIMNVYLGDTAAGATWPLPWESFQKEHPDKALELEVKWETEPLINNGVVARDDVPEQLAKRVAQQLDSLHTSVEAMNDKIDVEILLVELDRLCRTHDRRPAGGWTGHSG